MERPAMSNFSIAAMEPGEGALAYALIKTLGPEVSPDHWQAFVDTHSDRGGGILLLRGRIGGVFGLASYRTEDCARSGKLLLVENFVTIELSASAPGRKLLCEALVRIAAELGCEEVRQIVGCLPGVPGPARAMRNHLMLTDGSGHVFNRGPDCSCGSLAVLSAAEMYPAM
jgi:hypothetical protein